MKNLLGFVVILSMYSIAGQMDYVDAKIQDKINETYYAQVSSVDDIGDSEYIANVCSGLWVDDQNLNPECPSLEQYEEFQ